MYRKSDAMCEGEDAPPESEKTIPFKPSHDCLSQDSTRVLLSSTQPRLILSGHTHHYCVNNHTIGSTIVPEVSVPSFSWRNRNNPSFILVRVLFILKHKCAQLEFKCSFVPLGNPFKG